MLRKYLKERFYSTKARKILTIDKIYESNNSPLPRSACLPRHQYTLSKEGYAQILNKEIMTRIEVVKGKLWISSKNSI